MAATMQCSTHNDKTHTFQSSQLCSQLLNDIALLLHLPSSVQVLPAGQLLYLPLKLLDQSVKLLLLIRPGRIHPFQRSRLLRFARLPRFLDGLQAPS
jgi:hypothetical protein